MKTLSENLFETLILLGSAGVALSIFYLLAYYVQLKGLRKRTDKYQFASERETRALRKSSNLFSVGLSLYSFALIGEAIGLAESYTYFFVGFFSIMIGISIGYGLWAFLKYYYPFILEKRLHSIRFKSMVSQETGNVMTLLNENQEDVHLTKEMIKNEQTLAFDYDVWIDEASGHKVIERYNTNFHALVCENCNFRTLRDKSEEVIVEPTAEKQGLLKKHYECSYCGHHQSVDSPISSWKEEASYDKIADAVN